MFDLTKKGTAWGLLALTLAVSALAGGANAQGRPMSQNLPPPSRDDPIRVEARSVTPSRVAAGEGRPAAPPNPAAIMAAAQAQATAAGVSCQVTEALQLGMNAEGQAAYEAACATGPGYILIGGAPPQANDCTLLAGQAETARASDPAADVGVQCTIPVNLDVRRVIAQYASEASIACTVDQGSAIGKSPEGNVIYEVGCGGTDGYWLERVGTGWQAEPCIIVVSQNGACRFSTMAERAATMKATLAGSPAAACDVTEARYMGANSNGTFYEAKCAAGDGYIARVNAEMAVQQVYPCAGAERIGGGCTLTAASPAATAPAPATR